MGLQPWSAPDATCTWPEILAHPFSRLPIGLSSRSRVEAERHLRTRMSESSLGRLHVGTDADQRRRRQATKVVKHELGKPAASHAGTQTRRRQFV